MGKPGDEAAADKAEKEALPPVMDYLEGVVPEPGGFLVGDGVTLADIAVASPFVNLRHLGLDLSRWPRTLAYVGRHPVAAIVRAADRDRETASSDAPPKPLPSRGRGRGGVCR